jgi:hypothetical protein
MRVTQREPEHSAATTAERTVLLARRDVVDYTLQRRAALRDLRTGRRSAGELCDAHPHLKLAVRHYGRPAPDSCPVCRGEQLAEVHFVYGDELRQSAGQAKSVGELARMSAQYDRFDVYAVEVCDGCGWNHVVRSFTLGRDGLPDAAAEG